MSIVSKEDLLQKQAEAKNTLETFTCRVLVCSGTGCIASGAQKIYDEMAKLCENLDWVSVECRRTFHMSALSRPDARAYVNLDL